MLQSKTWQSRVLSQAKTAGDLDNWFWFIKIQLPGLRFQPALWPGQWMPVIPVYDDPEIARLIVKVLVEKLRKDNPATFQYHTQLIYRSQIGPFWYRYGVDDIVCEYCAGVGVDNCVCTYLFAGEVEPAYLAKKLRTAKSNEAV